MVISLAVKRLDYGCTTLVHHLFDRLQSVKSAAVRLVYRARKFDHITQLLRDLHWLCVPERIAVLAYRCQHGLGPSYWTTELHRVADVESRQRLR